MRLSLPAGGLLAVAAILLLTVAFPGGNALADHSGGLSCYACHTFSAGIVEPGTTSMSMSSMTEIKQHGWTTGQRLACTFCHRSTNSPAIPDALSDFTTMGVSRHPSGKNFITKAADNTAYLSNDNTTFPQSLDCQDCHDTTLTSYPNHDNTTWLNDSGAAGRTKSTNPFGLKNVTAPKAYDDLCRNCHSNASNFSSMTRGKSSAGTTKLFLATHDNGVDNTTYAIRDLDNTHLKTQAEYANKRQCTVCHDTHYSGNQHLFSDGHELDWNGVGKTAISETTDCTTVCHYRGDAQGSYDRYGHGKATNYAGTAMNRNCLACHDASKPHSPSSTDYITKFRFPTLDNSWVGPPYTVFGKAPRSICAQCHSGYKTHDTGKGVVGCIDCHDQHAKNSDNNVMMVRNTNRVAGSALGVTGVGAAIGSEAVLFRKSEKYPTGDPAGTWPADNVTHYFTNVTYGGPGTDNGNAGFCDQRACHGAGSKPAAPTTYFSPFATFNASGQHSGAGQTINTDCESCHKHTDTAGSFRAQSSCTICHGAPPGQADNSAGASYAYTEAISPHVLHATTYGYACQKCHVNYVDNNYHNTYPTLGYKTYQSVFFDNSVKRGASAYDNSTLTCTNITCHSDGRGGPPLTAPQWFIPPAPGVNVQLQCDDCHGGDLSFPVGRRIATGAHPAHLGSGYGCSSCHVSTVTDCNVVLVPGTPPGGGFHADNTRTVAIKAANDTDANPANNWNGVTGNCSGITCHGGNPVNWTADIGKVTCANCHARAGDVDDFGNGTVGSNDNNLITAGIDNAEWMGSGHGRDNAVTGYDVSGNPSARLLSGGGTGTNKCAFCHDPSVGHGNSSNPFRLANNDVFSQGWNGACYVCHAAASVGNSAPGYAPANDCTATPSGTYVAKTAGNKVGSNHFNPGSTVNARHSSTYNGGKFCWDCHDPHGDRTSGGGNIFMVGKRVTRASDNVFGFPVGGNDNSNRPAPVFTSNAGGPNYASTDNLAAYDGICEVCHLAASGVTHYTSTGKTDAHYNSKCIDCHTHDGGFKGAGGNNIEQFFDNAVRPGGAANNYNDLSRHTLRTDNVLAEGAQTNCYACHGVASTTYRQNECLKCHFENRATGTPTHPNALFEWAVPRTPWVQFGSAGPATDAFCLQCHGTLGAADNTLGNPAKTPVSIYTFGESSWTGGSGHGQATVKLAKDNGASGPGPAAYNCRDCHYSNGAQTGGQVRDNYPPGFHASMNRHLVRADNVAAGGREYPHPLDTSYTAAQRSVRMDNWCSTQCHRNLANGQAKDDNVVDHAWDKDGGQAKTPDQTHPSNFTITVGALYRQATSLPYSDWTTGGLPGAGNPVCITCHNPHGGGDIRDSVNQPVSPIGMKNMLRLSPADNVSSLCKQCHQ